MATDEQEMNLKAALIELVTLTQATDRDEKKLPELRKFIAEHDEIFKSVNILLNTPRNSLIRSMAGNKQGSIEVYMREADELKIRLSEDDDSPLVQLLIDRVVICFLRNCAAEMLLTLAGASGKLTYKQSECLDRELTRAHNRFLRACDALARMRVVEAMTETIRQKQSKPAHPPLALAR